MWNPFVDRVDADSETLNGRSNRHRQLLDDNLKWQRKAEELAGRHEQRIVHLEGVLEEKEIYISNIECMLADLSGRVSAMEGKLCRCRDEEDVEVAEVEDDDDPTSKLSYETVYHTPVAIAGLLEDVPNRLVPIGNLEITRGGFEEECYVRIRPDPDIPREDEKTSPADSYRLSTPERVVAHGCCMSSYL